MATKKIKLEAGAGFVRIDGTPHQKGALRVKYEGDEVTISWINSTNVLVEKTKFNDFVDNTGTPYASFAALKTAIETLFFQV
jgi:hypothetical protein